ncbi:glycerol-3-phosphate phosphatase-like [Chelonus insularis]|uniref:glycerol-3-phosphate phosphatase-like n=1 Tax=Chelonus insularis TaxID=460826 RepID=UPI001589168D|nr:glycerol-3-phosphate phosphatase-like [Chelonus insularis]
MINLNKSKDDELEQFIDSFDTVITDCDGVLWHENNPVPGASDVVNAFVKLGKKVYYVTNNSTKTRDEFQEKCKKLNFYTDNDCVLSPSYLLPRYLKTINFSRKVYLIGSSGIANELTKAGIPFIGLGPDPVTSLDLSFSEFKPDPDIGAVVIGFDLHFNYLKIMKAATYLKNRDVLFIATNTDEQFPGGNNIIIPGTGSLVRCVETCANRKALVIGKPSLLMSEALIANNKINPSRTIMIGDRCNTDILFGKRCNFSTLCVLTGVTTAEQLNNWSNSLDPREKELVPNYYIKSLADLLPHLQNKIK